MGNETAEMGTSITQADERQSERPFSRRPRGAVSSVHDRHTVRRRGLRVEVVAKTVSFELAQQGEAGRGLEYLGAHVW